MQLGLHQAATLLRLGDLPARQPDMRTDHHQPPAAGTTGRPDLPRGERALRFQPGQRTRERRTTAVDERPAPLQRLQPAQHDDLQVGVVGGIDHDERAAGDRGQDVGDPVGSALADVGQREGMDLIRGDRAIALLGDEFPQVRRGVAEGGVLGELAVADRNRCSGHVGPMDVTGGEPAGLEVGRHQQHPVEPGAGDPAPGGVDGPHLGQDVAAQGGIATADHLHGCAQALPEREQAAGDAAGQFDRRVFGQAAGVGQHEAGGTGFGQAGRVFGVLKHGDHRDVVHRLRAGGIVVQHGDTAAGGHVGGPDPVPRPRLVPHRRRGGEHSSAAIGVGVVVVWFALSDIGSSVDNWSEWSLVCAGSPRWPLPTVAIGVVRGLAPVLPALAILTSAFSVAQCTAPR